MSPGAWPPISTPASPNSSRTIASPSTARFGAPSAGRNCPNRAPNRVFSDSAGDLSMGWSCIRVACHVTAPGHKQDRHRTSCWPHTAVVASRRAARGSASLRRSTNVQIAPWPHATRRAEPTRSIAAAAWNVSITCAASAKPSLRGTALAVICAGSSRCLSAVDGAEQAAKIPSRAPLRARRRPLPPDRRAARRTRTTTGPARRHRGIRVETAAPRRRDGRASARSRAGTRSPRASSRRAHATRSAQAQAQAQAPTHIPRRARMRARASSSRESRSRRIGEQRAQRVQIDSA